MRSVFAVSCCWILACLASAACSQGSASPGDNASPSDQSSGIYGIVGAGGGAPPGVSVAVRGECVRIFDPTSQAQIATGTCDEHGNFRVALPPGRYIVSSMGQRRQVELRPGQWVSGTFVGHIPRAPSGRGLPAVLP